MEHSRSREYESRLLRKELNELEQQNGVLEKHIESLRKSTSSVETDVEFLSRRNDQLEKATDAFRHLIIDGLKSSSFLPFDQSPPLSLDNVDEFVLKLTRFINDNNKTDNPNEQVQELLTRLKTLMTGFKLNESLWNYLNKFFF